MAVVSPQISIQATLIVPENNFVISWQLASGGGVIGSIAPIKPYGNPFQVVIPNLTVGLTYIIILWESTTTSPAGTNRNSTNLTPSANTTTVRFPEYLVVDATPGLISYTSTYANTSYVGWGYDVEKVGQGTLFPFGAPNVSDPDYDQDIAGGFHYVRSGDVFAPGEKYVVRFQPQVAPVVASSVGPISGGLIITAPTTMNNTYLNQALYLQGSGSALPIILPTLSSVMDYQFLYFYSAGGNHITSMLTCPGSDKIQYNTLITQMRMCQAEQLKLFKANGVWNIDQVSPNVAAVGELVYKYTNTEFPYVFANGALVSRTAYAGLFAWVNANPAVRTSEATWANPQIVDGTTYYPNKGLFTLGDGSTTFRVPLLANYYLRPVDGSVRAAGSFGVETVRPHDQTMHGSGLIDDNASHPASPKWYLGRANGGYSGVGGNLFGRQISTSGPDTTMRTGKDCNPSGLGITPFETTPINYGSYVLIRI